MAEVDALAAGEATLVEREESYPWPAQSLHQGGQGLSVGRVSNSAGVVVWDIGTPLDFTRCRVARVFHEEYR